MLDRTQGPAADEDLGDLISQALVDSSEDDLDPVSEIVDDPWTQPTVSVVSDRDRVEALEEFTAGRKALGEGELTLARQLIERAAALDPTDSRFPTYLDQIASEERRQQRLAEAAARAHATPVAQPPTARRLPALTAAVAIVAVIAAWSATRPTGAAALPDVAAEHQAVAPFTELVLATEGGWSGTIDAPLAHLAPAARHAECQRIARALPGEGTKGLVLRSTDGKAVACTR